MPRNLPPQVEALLEAPPGPFRDRAWSAFLRHYHRYILGTARYLSRDYDGAMDRYRFVLEELQLDDFRRLRGYVVDPRSRFSTWLVVVVRRLCRDFERRKYGRSRPDSGPEAHQTRAVRRRLVDLVAEDIDSHPILDGTTADPQLRLERDERQAALRVAMKGLSAEDRLILKLRFEDDLPASQIARVVQLPSVFHVYRRLKKLQAYIRAQLEDGGVVE